MTTFYLYEGQNESGPFTLEELKQKRISRTTPLRQKDSDKWLPAEKVRELKEVVAPRKIKKPKDVLPAVAEHVSYLHYRKSKLLYGTLLIVAMLLGLSFYSVRRQASTAADEPPDVKDNLSKAQIVSEAVALPNEAAKNTKAALLTTSPKEDAAKASRQHWNKLISATNSNYGIGFFGGIKDLSVIVSNRTDYPLDQVVAKVAYIKASGEVWKTKEVTMYAVPPGESKEEALPDVGRGKKVKVSLYKIVSRKMKFSYTQGRHGSDPNDPYYNE